MWLSHLPGRDSEAHQLGEAFAAAAVDRRRLVMVAAAGKLFGSSLDLDTVLDRVTTEVAQAIGDCCVINLVDESGGLLVPRHLHHTDPQRGAAIASAFLGKPFRADEGDTAEPFATARPVLVPSVAPGRRGLLTTEGHHLAQGGVPPGRRDRAEPDDDPRRDRPGRRPHPAAAAVRPSLARATDRAGRRHRAHRPGAAARSQHRRPHPARAPPRSRPAAGARRPDPARAGRRQPGGQRTRRDARRRRRADHRCTVGRPRPGRALRRGLRRAGADRGHRHGHRDARGCPYPRLRALLHHKALGTGLGLATVHGIVTEMGGTLRIDSVSGARTTIDLELPALYPSEPLTDPAPEPIGPAEHGLPPRPGGGEAVLVVEDEERLRGPLRRLLEQCGFAVTLAVDGADALDQLDAGLVVDIVLTDVVMPRLTGAELAGALAERRPGLPVVFMSGATPV